MSYTGINAGYTSKEYMILMFNSVDCRNNEKGMLWKVIKVYIVMRWAGGVDTKWPN